MTRGFLGTGHTAVLAHRGDTANHPPGNTWPALASAVELGVDHLETDVQLSRDGVLVLFHDERLEDSTTGEGAVADLSWAELQRLRYVVDGEVLDEGLVRFDEALAAWPAVFWNVDAKVHDAADPLLDAVERAGAHDRVLVTSFSYRTARALERRVGHPTPRGASKPEVIAARLASLLGVRPPGGCRAYQVPERWRDLPVVDRRFVDAAHRADKVVHVWTVNDTDEMHRLLDLGVDAVITDDPARARTVLEERGEW